MMRSCVKIMLDHVFAIAVAQFVLAMTICGELEAATAGEEFSEATRLAATGAFADSVTHWKKAEALFEEAKNFPGQVETKIHLAAAYPLRGRRDPVPSRPFVPADGAMRIAPHLVQPAAA